MLCNLCVVNINSSKMQLIRNIWRQNILSKPKVYRINRTLSYNHIVSNPNLGRQFSISKQQSAGDYRCSSRNITFSLFNHYFTSYSQKTLYHESRILFGKHSRTFSTVNSPVQLNSTKAEAVTLQSKEKETSVDNPDGIIEEVELEHARSLFPVPKRTLHNIFNTVAEELKKPELKLSPHNKLTRRGKSILSWTCTYHLKWPEEIKFSHTGKSVQEASNKSALAALIWLKRNKNIDKSFQPVIYNVEESEKMISNKSPVLMLDKSVETKLKEIVELYDNTLLPHIVNNLEQSAETQPFQEDLELEKIWPEIKTNNLQRGLANYQAHEPVQLPISDFKENIKQMIEDNKVVIVKGEPGCGKSTRVPQYILEAWAEGKNNNSPCRIIVTEPRRIAAISLAERVANEREESVGETIGYQVRLQSKFNRNSGRIMYCTTGILLRRLQTDPNLSDCTHIILDEAHERDVSTDLLMNLLRYALKSNPNLKVIVMSATIDTNIFQEYFTDAAVIHIPGFTFPVKVNFLENIKGVDLTKTKNMANENGPYVVCDDVVKVINYIHRTKEEGAILCFLPGWEDITSVRRALPPSRDMSVLCLHSRLEDSEQRKIFSRPPPGVRKVILSTNIAETSVTIDDVVHVIDTGIHKEQRFDGDKGIMCIDNHWISQSSMKQRKGRAGRVQKGISYHLYPESRYNTFSKYSMPEILRTSLTKIVLDGKVYSNNMNAFEFLGQLPCPPDKNVIMKAIEELKELELLDENENLTPLGRKLSDFQLEPKLSKAMVNSIIFKCATPIVDIVTLFSSETELFASGLIDKEGVKKVKAQYSKTSDHLSLMRIFEEWLDKLEERHFNSAEQFCYENNLLNYKLHTIKKLRKIHFEYLYKGLNDVLPISDDFSDNDEIVKGVLLSGVGTILLHRNYDLSKGRVKAKNVFLTRHNHKATVASESVNFKRGYFPTDFMVYMNEMVSNIRRTTIVRESSLISPLTVLLFKNSKIQIKEIPKESYRNEIKSNDQVLVQLAGTKIELVCDKKQAMVLKKCKDALQGGLQYYIFQLTKGAEYNREVNKHWDSMLTKLNEALEDVKIV